MKHQTDWDKAYIEGTSKVTTEEDELAFDQRMEWVGRGLGVLCIVMLGMFFYKLLA